MGIGKSEGSESVGSGLALTLFSGKGQGNTRCLLDRIAFHPGAFLDEQGPQPTMAL
jgi:hypothetical protein